MEALIIVGLVVFNLVVLLHCVLTTWQSLAAQKWPSTIGRLISAYIDVDEEVGEYSPRLVYSPKINYRYEVRGRSYEGFRLAYGLLRISRESWVQSLMDEALTTSPLIKIKYNPRRPQDAVLIVGLRWFHWLNISITLLFTSLVLAAIFEG